MDPRTFIKPSENNQYSNKEPECMASPKGDDPMYRSDDSFSD